jgi:hypothetical protein
VVSIVDNFQLSDLNGGAVNFRRSNLVTEESHSGKMWPPQSPTVGHYLEVCLGAFESQKERS